MFDTRIAQAVNRLSESPYRSLPRIALDLLLWAATALFAIKTDRWWAYAAAIAFIGAAPLHDLLIHGHEGTHDLISRKRWINEVFGWLTLALVGMSLTAHKAFHLDHHRYAHTADDPEFQLFNRIVRNVPGWAYLIIPYCAILGVNLYPFSSRRPREERRPVIRDLTAALLLHAALALTFGIQYYLLFVTAPTFTGLAAVTFLRAITEHHAAYAGDPWKDARSIETSRVVEFLWSNVNYHLEHHLFPFVPFHELPQVRHLLIEEYRNNSALLDRGYLRTAFALLREPVHFKVAVL